jgi:hypothetical protein
LEDADTALYSTYVSTLCCTVSGRRIRLIEDNAKYLRLKSDLERDFVAAVYLFEAPSTPRFLSWGGQQFCSFQIWSDTECKSPTVYIVDLQKNATEHILE